MDTTPPPTRLQTPGPIDTPARRPRELSVQFRFLPFLPNLSAEPRTAATTVIISPLGVVPGRPQPFPLNRLPLLHHLRLHILHLSSTPSRIVAEIQNRSAGAGAVL